jgi:hypothetical protein
MPKYLVEGRYTSDGLKGLAREGSSPRRAGALGWVGKSNEVIRARAMLFP